MNFKQWANRYYPKEDRVTLQKMSHAWASGHFNMLAKHESEMCPECEQNKSDGMDFCAFCGRNLNAKV